MTSKSLLSQLEKAAQIQAAKDPHAPNITYQQYDLDVEGTTTGVLIPIRECSNFENKLLEVETLSTYKLKGLVREFRGLFVQ